MWMEPFNNVVLIFVKQRISRVKRIEYRCAQMNCQTLDVTVAQFTGYLDTLKNMSWFARPCLHEHGSLSQVPQTLMVRTPQLPCTSKRFTDPFSTWPLPSPLMIGEHEVLNSGCHKHLPTASSHTPQGSVRILQVRVARGRKPSMYVAIGGLGGGPWFLIT